MFYVGSKLSLYIDMGGPHIITYTMFFVFVFCGGGVSLSYL